MTYGRITARAIRLLVIILGLSLSACGPGSHGYVHERYPYYAYPAYGVFGYDYGGLGGWGWRRGWDYGHWDHGGWGHGFAHGGFGGHGGGGYR